MSEKLTQFPNVRTKRHYRLAAVSQARVGDGEPRPGSVVDRGNRAEVYSPRPGPGRRRVCAAGVWGDRRRLRPGGAAGPSPLFPCGKRHVLPAALRCEARHKDTGPDTPSLPLCSLPSWGVPIRPHSPPRQAPGGVARAARKGQGGRRGHWRVAFLTESCCSASWEAQFCWHGICPGGPLPVLWTGL